MRDAAYLAARTQAQAEFLRMVPVGTRPTIVEMLRQPAISLEGLRAQVHEHALEYIAESEVRRDLDPALAHGLEAACGQLLALVEAGLPDDERAIVQAACEYFVFDDDLDDDFDGITGLDDDAEVVNAALSVFGLAASAIKIG